VFDSRVLGRVWSFSGVLGFGRIEGSVFVLFRDEVVPAAADMAGSVVDRSRCAVLLQGDTAGVRSARPGGPLFPLQASRVSGAATV